MSGKKGEYRILEGATHIVENKLNELNEDNVINIIQFNTSTIEYKAENRSDDQFDTIHHIVAHIKPRN